MTDKMETPHPDNTDDHNEWLERQIDKEMDDGVWDHLIKKPTGSMGKLAEVERHLKKKG